jgi:16S rRNA (guanine527-N7)-methyltransferase
MAPVDVLTEREVRDLLAPFELELDSHQAEQIVTYLDLLLRWNVRINLTAVRTPEECVTRHFGETLYLSRWVELRGENLDIGSGAGFPGLALKIAFPGLATTLLEPVAKKRAFLKEVVRACGMESVEVRPERLDEFLNAWEARVERGESKPGGFDSWTARAVGQTQRLAEAAPGRLTPGGRLCLWVSVRQAQEIAQGVKSLTWQAPLRLPQADRREILIGERTLDRSSGPPANIRARGRSAV